MSEPPPLPESDDPYEVLGATPDEDLVALRRRYVHLIKAYRPDTHPREFARIREAWERAQAGARLRSAETRFERAQAAPKAEERAREPEVLAAYGRAWNAARARDFDVSRRALETLARRPGEGARAWAHRFLLEELAGIVQPERVWSAAIEAGADVSGWMRSLLDPAELRRAAGLLRQGWPALRRLSDAGFARKLLRARLHDALWRGHDRLALAEIDDRAFRDDATGDPGLGRLAHEVACALVWNDPDRAVEIVEAFPSDADDPLVDHVHLALRATAQWAKWNASHGGLEPFVRFVRFASIAEADEILELSVDLWTDFRRRPDRYLAAFEHLPSVAASVYLGQVNDLLERHDLEAPSPPTDLDRALREADARLYPRSMSLVEYGIGAAIVGGVVVRIWRFGWWVTGALVAGVVLAAATLNRLEARVHARWLRPVLARYMIESGASPATIDAWIRRTKKLKHLDSMRSKIAEDESLSLVHATVRLGDVLPALQRAATDTRPDLRTP